MERSGKHNLALHPQLPEGWELVAEGGLKFYYQSSTRSKQWHRPLPEGLEEDLKVLKILLKELSTKKESVRGVRQLVMNKFVNVGCHEEAVKGIVDHFNKLSSKNPEKLFRCKLAVLYVVDSLIRRSSSGALAESFEPSLEILVKQCVRAAGKGVDEALKLRRVVQALCGEQSLISTAIQRRLIGLVGLSTRAFESSVPTVTAARDEEQQEQPAASFPKRPPSPKRGLSAVYPPPPPAPPSPPRERKKGGGVREGQDHHSSNTSVTLEVPEVETIKRPKKQITTDRLGEDHYGSLGRHSRGLDIDREEPAEERQHHRDNSGNRAASIDMSHDQQHHWNRAVIRREPLMDKNSHERQHHWDRAAIRREPSMDHERREQRYHREGTLHHRDSWIDRREKQGQGWRSYSDRESKQWQHSPDSHRATNTEVSHCPDGLRDLSHSGNLLDPSIHLSSDETDRPADRTASPTEPMAPLPLHNDDVVGKAELPNQIVGGEISAMSLSIKHAVDEDQINFDSSEEESDGEV